MKKILLLMMGVLMALPASAQVEMTLDSLVFKLYTPEGAAPYAEVSGHTFPKGIDPIKVEIPASVEKDGVEYPVTRIGDSAFLSCAAIKWVDIPNSIEEIGRKAFAQCSNLREIDFPDHLTELGEYIFNRCSSLQTVHLPASLKTIPQFAFYQCKNIYHINLPDSLVSIGLSAFRHCRSLTEVTIPPSVTTIDERAFDYCENLETVTLSCALTTINYRAFGECPKITEINYLTANPIPAVKGIFDDEVYNNATLYVADGGIANAKATEPWMNFVNISERICRDGMVFRICHPEGASPYAEVIGNQLTQATDLEIPASITVEGADYPVTVIASKSFQGCPHITSLKIPDTVTEIGNGAFDGCSNLTSGLILSNVTKIGDGAFYCPLSWAVVKKHFTGYDRFPFSYDTKVAIPSSVGYNAQIVFPDDSEITDEGVIYGPGRNALYFVPSTFEGEFEIPRPVSEISPKAFAQCKNLTSVSVPYSMQKIGEFAFFNCENLIDINIPTYVREIGIRAFVNCISLTKIELGDSLVYLGERAFGDCRNLSSVKLSKKLEYINQDTFSGCDSLTSITIPNSVKYIGNHAFANSGLESIDLPASVDCIAAWAFNGCSNLKSVSLPESLTELWGYAFGGCKAITEVNYLTDSPVAAMDNYVFEEEVYQNATLNVAPGGIEKAKTTEPWMYFANIKEKDPVSGISEVESELEPNAPIEVYDLNGIKVSTNVDNLPAGFYIVRRGSEVTKIIVK